MAYNTNYYQDAKQQAQDYDENQEKQYPVYTSADSEFQDHDQALNQGLHHGHNTSQGHSTPVYQQGYRVYNVMDNGLPTETLPVPHTAMFVPAQCVPQQTFYNIQQPYSNYDNGLGSQIFQGYPQNGQMIFPIQIQGSIFYSQQIFNPYSNIFQTQTYDVQPFQSHVPLHQDANPFQSHVQVHQDAQPTTTFIPPHQDSQQTTSFTPPHQYAQQTTTSNDRSINDTVYQTWQYEYKPWYCSEFTVEKYDGEEDSDDHKPTEIIIEKTSQASAPEVVQEEQNPEEVERKEVPSSDAARTSDYAENLWELICKFCPAESSVSSLLVRHLCDMSLTVPEQEGNIICNTCFTRLPSGMTLEAHKKTRRHILLLLNYKGDTKIDELHFFYCSTCRVQCNRYAAYTDHMLSQKHLEFTERIPFNLYYCSKCKLTMDATAYEVHLSSKTHVINCMISNTRLFYLISNLDTSNLFCKMCKEKFVNKKLFKGHLYSFEHCSKLLQIKVKNDYSHSYQYVFIDNNQYVCVLCKIGIADKPSLIYHFLTDEHMSREDCFEKMQHARFISGELYVTAHIREQYFQCSECKTLQRDCEHMFKNDNEYKTWMEKIEKGKYCMYCNCFSDVSHNSSELHKKMLSTIKYCQACDKVLSIDIVKHNQGSRHKKTLKTYGIKGVENKRGPSTIFCGICNLTSDTEGHHIEHLAGANHRTNYNIKCIENRFHCKPCNFTITNLYQYEEHVNSEDHKKKLIEIDKQYDYFKFCFICRQPITNGTISEHIETVQHIDTIKMM